MDENSAELILEATKELLWAMIRANGIEGPDIASAIFTTTPDLTAAFPAGAARAVGWRNVPLLDACEIAVPGSLCQCIRVLLHWNTELSQDEIQHIYLNGTHSLRPDLAPVRANPRGRHRGGEGTKG